VQWCRLLTALKRTGLQAGMQAAPPEQETLAYPNSFGLLDVGRLLRGHCVATRGRLLQSTHGRVSKIHTQQVRNRIRTSRAAITSALRRLSSSRFCCAWNSSSTSPLLRLQLDSTVGG
jgi:hypothetical protein